MLVESAPINVAILLSMIALAIILAVMSYAWSSQRREVRRLHRVRVTTQEQFGHQTWNISGMTMSLDQYAEDRLRDIHLVPYAVMRLALLLHVETIRISSMGQARATIDADWLWHPGDGVRDLGVLLDLVRDIIIELEDNRLAARAPDFQLVVRYACDAIPRVGLSSWVAAVRLNSEEKTYYKFEVSGRLEDPRLILEAVRAFFKKPVTVEMAA